LESLLLGEVSQQLACLAEAPQWIWWLRALGMLKKAGEAMSAPLAGCTRLSSAVLHFYTCAGSAPRLGILLL